MISRHTLYILAAELYLSEYAALQVVANKREFTEEG